MSQEAASSSVAHTSPLQTLVEVGEQGGWLVVGAGDTREQAEAGGGALVGRDLWPWDVAEHVSPLRFSGSDRRVIGSGCGTARLSESSFLLCVLGTVTSSLCCPFPHS